MREHPGSGLSVQGLWPRIDRSENCDRLSDVASCLARPSRMEQEKPPGSMPRNSVQISTP